MLLISIKGIIFQNFNIVNNFPSTLKNNNKKSEDVTTTTSEISHTDMIYSSLGIYDCGS